MKAAVFHDKEQLLIQDVAMPTLEAGEVLLQIEACNVCGTDMRIFYHGHHNIKPPRVLGHEFVGRVVESKAPNANLKVGDRVVMYIVLACGECKYCRAGRENLCVNRTTMAYNYDGAFAEFMKVPAKAVSRGQLFKVREDMPSEHLALAEPLGCVINAHGNNRLEIGLKDTVAVIGSGPIGIMHALVARASGAQKVFMFDVNQARLDQMSQFDIDGTVLVNKDGSHYAQAQELTDGFGFDVVIVAASVASAQADALEMAGKGGRVEFFGGLPKSNPISTLNANHIHYKELRISGSFSEKMSDFQAAKALIEGGRFPSDKIVTHELPLARTTEAFGLMQSGEALKVCIRPNLI
jgi:L-iditol 2-dehydrogenase